MPRIEINDYSGGLWEAYASSDFTERQSTQLKGLVIEDAVRLRSQGAIQRVGNVEASVRAVHIFRGRVYNYAVIFRTNGQVAWAQVPPTTASNITTKSLTFTNFTYPTTFLGVSVNVPFDNDHFRPTSEFTYRNAQNEFVPGLLVSGHSSGTSAAEDSFVIYESGNTLAAKRYETRFPQLSRKVEMVSVLNEGSGYNAPPAITFTGGGGSGAEAEAKVANGKITSIIVKKGGSGYTTAPTVVITPTDGGTGASAFSIIEKGAVVDVLPRHNVAATWGGNILVLGDIEWSAANADGNLSAANVRRYSNMAWITDIDALNPNSLTFDPRYPARLAPEGSTIVGIQQVAEGLIIITTASNGEAGLTLLRGSPNSYELEVLRPGLGVLAGTENYTNGHVHAWWNEVASTLFVDNVGKLHQVRGEQTERVDRYGPEAPERGNVYDKVVVTGGQLFMYRSGRMLVLRSFGDEGAWSELVLPEGTITSMFAFDDSVWFACGGKLYRYCIEGPPAERGLIDGQAVDLVYGSRVLGSPGDTEHRWWQGATIRCQGLANAVLKRVKLLAGSPLLSPAPAGATFELAQALGRRELVSVPGLGPSVECAVQLTFQGDVRLEDVCVDVTPGWDRL